MSPCLASCRTCTVGRPTTSTTCWICAKRWSPRERHMQMTQILRSWRRRGRREWSPRIETTVSWLWNVHESRQQTICVDKTCRFCRILAMDCYSFVKCSYKYILFSMFSSRCREEPFHVGRDAEGHRVWSPLLHPRQTRHEQRQRLPQRPDHVQVQTGRTCHNRQ